MDPASIFEDALRGLATKDFDDSNPSDEQVNQNSDASKDKLLDIKHKTLGPAKSDDLPVQKSLIKNDSNELQNDIILNALINAGITPSSLGSSDNGTNAPAQPASSIRVLNTKSATIFKVLPASTLSQNQTVMGNIPNNIIKRSMNNGYIGSPTYANLPNIIRKRPITTPENVIHPLPKIRRVSSYADAQNKLQPKFIYPNASNLSNFNSWSNQPAVHVPGPAHNMRFANLSQVARPYQFVKRDDELEEDEDLAQAETYAEYVPAKLKFGRKHPDPVVESSSLSSVSPSDIHYQLSLPEEVIERGSLSALQLEAVVYACQRHECTLPNGQRAGFLIGDGAGVGKGRTIAGILYENYLKHRKKAIWLSVSNDLRVDAERDLRDVGLGKMKVHSLNKFKYARISGKANGRVKKGVIFCTYSSLIGESQGSAKAKYKTRLKQLVHWCGKKFDGVIVFDECHRAKNLTPSGSQKPTKTGLTVLELQNRLPNARVIYASATGATEPRNMGYMTRLGLWGDGTSFKTFNSFIQMLERRGVGAMELMAMDMKLRGMYIARQLSFHGVHFNTKEVHIENVRINGESFVQIYNQAADLWVYAYRFFSEASRLLNLNDRYRKTMWGQFWSAHQRFFKYLCIAAKVDACVDIAKSAVQEGKCVVIGLQSTGEAKTLEQVEEFGSDLGEFVSTAKGVFQSLVDKYFPTSINVDNFNLRGDKLASAGDRFSSTTLNRAGRAVAGGQGCGLGLKDILGEKMLAKLVAGGSLSSSNLEDDNYHGSTKPNPDKDSPDSDNDDLSDASMDEDSDSTKLTSNHINNNNSLGGANSSSSDYYDSDLELNSGNGRNQSKKSNPQKNNSVSNRRKQKHNNHTHNNFDSVANSSDGELDEEDWDPDALFDSFLARNMAWTMRDSDSKQILSDGMKKRDESRVSSDDLWNDEATWKLSQKYLFGRNGSIKNGLPLSSTDAMGISQEEAKRQCTEMQNLLLHLIDKLGPKLPPSSLDELIDKLGGPSQVAEMTGRKGRMVMSTDGRVCYESRRELDINLELLNLTEKQRFMDGEKLIAIISEAASSGISLQADRRAVNQRRRVHITLELPWSADRAVQQFGRTHRSNQVSAPKYIFLISNLAGEQRFASTVAKRLESLGALTHGDRRATETRDLSQFNFDTKLGREALELVLRACISGDDGIVEPPKDYMSLNSSPTPNDSNVDAFFRDVKASLQGVGLATGRCRERDSNQMSKFLNRILGMRVHIQNCLFQYFSETLDELTRRAKRDNRLDLGIMDLGTTGQNLEIVWTKSFDTWFLSESTKIHLHKVVAERGMSWSSAMELYTQYDGINDGFYLPCNSTSKVVIPVMAVYIKSKSSTPSKNESKYYRLYRPNTGMQFKPIELEKLLERYKKVSNPSDCQELWHLVFKESSTRCIHLLQHNICPFRSQNRNQCEVGLRVRNYYVLSGSVLNVWARIEPLLQYRSNSARCMQVVRLKSKDGKRIVGSLIPQECVNDVLNCLTLPLDPSQTLPIVDGQTRLPNHNYPFMPSISSTVRNNEPSRLQSFSHRAIPYHKPWHSPSNSTLPMQNGYANSRANFPHKFEHVNKSPSLFLPNNYRAPFTSNYRPQQTGSFHGTTMNNNNNNFSLFKNAANAHPSMINNHFTQASLNSHVTNSPSNISSLIARKTGSRLNAALSMPLSFNNNPNATATTSTVNHMNTNSLILNRNQTSMGYNNNMSLNSPTVVSMGNNINDNSVNSINNGYNISNNISTNTTSSSTVNNNTNLKTGPAKVIPKFKIKWKEG